MQTNPTGDERELTILEGPKIPPVDLVFAFLPMLPFVAGAAASWIVPARLAAVAFNLTLLWASAILLFLSGVRRGLSFRTVGGPTLAQMNTMLVLFGLGFGALGLTWLGARLGSVTVLLLGYGLLLGLDPIAARRGEVPLHFGRLRRVQLPIGLLGLTATGSAILLR